MKAYVIKSNNDMWYLSNSPFYKWTQTIEDARIELYKEDAEQVLECVYRRLCDGKIVPITICEGDIAEENHQLKETINSFQQNKRTASVVINTLKQQLEEKDKEIEMLRKGE